MQKDFEGVKLLWKHRAGGWLNMIYSVAIADEYVVAGGTNSEIYLFNYAGKLLESCKMEDIVYSVAIGDKYIAAGTGSNDKKVHLIDYSGKLLLNYKTRKTVHSVTIKDKYVAAGGKDNNVYLFDYSGKLIWNYEIKDTVYSVAIGDGYVVAGAGSWDKNIYLFDYSGKLIWNYEIKDTVYSVAIGDGCVAAGSRTKNIYLFDYSGKLLWTYEMKDVVYSISIGNECVVVGTGNEDKKVYLFDYSGKLLWSYKIGNTVRSVAISGMYVAAGSYNGYTYLFEIPSFELKTRVKPEIAIDLNNKNAEEFLKKQKEIEETECKKPELYINIIADIGFKVGMWEKLSATIMNIGEGEAKNVKIHISGPIEIGGIKIIPKLECDTKKETIIGIKPIEYGNLPLDVSISYKNEFDTPFEIHDVAYISVAKENEMVSMHPQSVFNIGSIGEVLGKGATKVGDVGMVKGGIGSTEKPFSKCPYCGEVLNLSKTPKYCPYCGDELR